MNGKCGFCKALPSRKWRENAGSHILYACMHRVHKLETFNELQLPSVYPAVCITCHWFSNPDPSQWAQLHPDTSGSWMPRVFAPSIYFFSFILISKRSFCISFWVIPGYHFAAAQSDKIYLCKTQALFSLLPNISI